jgi:hypothetical protein
VKRLDADAAGRLAFSHGEIGLDRSFQLLENMAPREKTATYDIDGKRLIVF